MNYQDLIARLEKSDAAYQTAVMCDVLKFAVDADWITVKQRDRAVKMILEEAYESAAIILLPGDCYWAAGFGKMSETEPLGGASIFKPGKHDDPLGQGEAATVALALCIAALKARQSLTSAQEQ